METGGSTYREAAVDALRGLVILLMALDHASHAFNADRYVTDSVALYEAGSSIPAVQFTVRWLTHVCAPTFLFLAGWSLSRSISRRLLLGVEQRRIDGDLFKRGLLIMALDPLWMSFGFGYGILFQVLYAIGGSFMALMALRRLRPMPLLVASLAFMVFSEAAAGLAIALGGGERAGPIGAFLVTGGRIGERVFVLYPLLPWLAYMTLGWALGRLQLEGRLRQSAGIYALAGLGALIVFVVVRGLNGFGNMLLYRDGASLVQWLHVSKYPPSLSFSMLELGVMFLLLALLTILYRRRQQTRFDPLIVFGQTPLFFYILHVHLLSAAAHMLDRHRAGGLPETLAATAGVILLLAPLCLAYRWVKRRYPESVLSYV